MPLEQCSHERYLADFAGRRLIHQAITWYAARKPAEPAIINATRGTSLTWAELDRAVTACAARLLRLGFRKGDFLATTLPLLTEHVILEYACFRTGVIHVPLDLRLSPAETARCLDLVGAREHVRDADRLRELVAGDAGGGDVEWPEIHPADGAQVIFTTGSTGRPKPALLSHGGITAQNYAIGTAFEFDSSRVLDNLPASHVGGQAELLMTTLAFGGTAVILEIFDPGKSLEAIEKYKVRLLGQIPAMFLMEWRHSDYPKRDLSSLDIVVYGGQAVPRPFLEKMKTMGPRIGTGLGLTETSGFCTYTEVTGDVDAVARSLGHSMPIYPMTIREPIRPDGRAGAALPTGQIGNVCFRGPQTFLGYVNDPEATAQTLSSDGFLYTGDMGYVDEAGLHFSGRARWIIKPAGFQVFPGDVENHFCAMQEKVASCGVVGVEHPIWLEAIVAFVEKRPGAELTTADLRRHARSLTSYMRPLHYVIVEPGQMPLNRVAKIDTLRLKDLAEEEVRQLKQRGRWESGDESQD